jgi:hypothetical protein
MTVEQMILCLSVYSPDAEILVEGQIGWLTIHNIEPGWTEKTFKYVINTEDVYRNGDLIPEEAAILVITINTEI